MREALDALDLVVVIDVALTETARYADYVLPAASQFEKWECTFFNLEFPHNYFHLRRPVFEPMEGTLPESEIHARCAGRSARTATTISRRSTRPQRSVERSTPRHCSGSSPNGRRWASCSRSSSTRRSGRHCGPRTASTPSGAAAVWGLAQTAAGFWDASMRRAGFGDPARRRCARRRPVRCDPRQPVGRHVLRRRLRRDDAPTRNARRSDQPRDRRRCWTSSTHSPTKLRCRRRRDDAFPLVLSAGERRSSTANTIYRDPSWRKNDQQGALRVSPADAERLGLAAGDRARVTTKRGRGDRGRRGDRRDA